VVVKPNGFGQVRVWFRPGTASGPQVCCPTEPGFSAFVSVRSYLHFEK
jgi:hypothetical protein